MSEVGSAGYSGTPLHRKLGVKPGHRVLVRHSPPGWDVRQVDPEQTAEAITGLAQSGGDSLDVVLQFCPDAAAMAERLPEVMAVTATAGRCWIAWPKRSSGVPTDLREDDVRAAALAVGWVDVKVCAVDATWSGLCLVRRLANR